MNLVDVFGVAPAGVSGAYCRSCKHYLPFNELVDLARKNNNCNNCYAPIHVDDVGVSFQKDSIAVARDKNIVSTVSWFHATQKSNWLTELMDADVVAHVGSKRSAFQRAIDSSRSFSQNFGPWRLYELQVSGNAFVNADVEYDVDDDAVRTVEDLQDTHNVDVVRYVNMYEDCGSVSLIVNPNLLTVVDVSIFLSDELYAEYIKLNPLEV